MSKNTKQFFLEVEKILDEDNSIVLEQKESSEILETLLSVFQLNQNIVFDYLFISSHKPV